YNLQQAHALALTECGRYRDAVHVFDQLERRKSERCDAAVKLSAVLPYVVALCVAGETDRAEHKVASLTSVARQSGSVPHMGKIARAAARIRAERGHAHSARLLSQEAVRLHEQNGHR